MRTLFVWSCLFFSPYIFAQNEVPNDINLQGQLPRVEFDSAKYDFGAVYRGAKVNHSFAFQNSGNGVLMLNGLHATCGCVNAVVTGKDGKTPQNLFQPGEGGIVSVDLDTSQFSGAIVRSVTAETNMGSASPTVTLTMTATVLQEIYASPALVYIGKLNKNDSKNFRVSVGTLSRAKTAISSDVVDTSASMQSQIEASLVAKPWKSQILNNSDEVKVFAVETSNPNIEAKLLTAATPSSSPQIEISLKNSLPIGPFTSTLIVWNNSTFYKNLKIPLVGEVVGRVNQSAKYVEFGVVSDQKSSERIIDYSSSLKNFAITSVKINMRRAPEMAQLHDSDIFILKKEKIAAKDANFSGGAIAYRLHFKLVYPRKSELTQTIDKSAGMNVSGNFLVKTNDPDYKEISVPFFGVLRKEP